MNSETQQEIDDLWEKLSAGGEKMQCGWLKAKFGVTWQIVSTILGELLRGGKAPKKSQSAMKAMLQLTKLDIAKLKQAYVQG